MNSQQLSYYNDPNISETYLENIDYKSIFQNKQNLEIPYEVYQTNYESNNQNEDYNQIINQYNYINNLYQIETSNQNETKPLINIEEQKNTLEQYNTRNEYISNYEQNQNYPVNNNIDNNTNLNYNFNTYNINNQTDTNDLNENNQVKFIENNNIYQNEQNNQNEIKLEPNSTKINLVPSNVEEYPKTQPNNINSNNPNINTAQNPNNINIGNNIQDNQNIIEISSSKLDNQDKISSNINQLNSSELNQEERKIISLKLANPLESNLTLSLKTQKLPSNKEGSEIGTNNNIIEEEKELNYNNLFQAEEIILRNNDEYKKKLFDFKTHFDLSLTKEENNFIYDKVHKIITPLLGHYEMPQDLKYVSPILSSNEKYLACIGRGKTDWVFVWEMTNLYWYKYKFSFSKVDCITFTPDSKHIIIIYKNTCPIMYNLSTGKMKLKFEKNGEENYRQGYQCSFTTTGTHFALTTKQSFTLWSLRNGKIRQKYIDNSPVKIICDEYLINIDTELNCVIKKISNQSIIEKFQIKGVSTPEEILDARCTDDMKNFVYVIKHGIVNYNFRNREFKGLQRFEYGVERASLSFDGKYVMKTNMKNLCINDLEKETNILTILKERFNDYKIDFNSKKIITIDNISITIRDLFDEKPFDKHVWLNKNPTKFKEIKFNRDFSILFARLDNNNIIAYDIKTGFILNKWVNIEENYIDYSITHYGRDRIAIKSNRLLIKVWNFITQREESTFYGYNSNSISFSADGNYLITGTKKGPEVARIWDIDNLKYAIFRFNGVSDNLNTKVHITTPQPKRLICCSVNQEPLIFNTYTKELLFKCECPVKFKEILDIQSNLKNNIFIVKGKDYENKNMGIMYQISDGSLLQLFINYTILKLAKTENILIITKCDNVNGGKLCSIDYKNKDEQIFHDFQIQTNKCELLDDMNTAIIQYGDKYSKEFNLININNGNFMGKINLVNNLGRNIETYINVDDSKNEILFRYFEFLSPEETMAYLKKDEFYVEGKNNE